MKNHTQLAQRRHCRFFLVNSYWYLIGLLWFLAIDKVTGNMSAESLRFGRAHTLVEVNVHIFPANVIPHAHQKHLHLFNSPSKHTSEHGKRHRL